MVLCTEKMYKLSMFKYFQVDFKAEQIYKARNHKCEYGILLRLEDEYWDVLETSTFVHSVYKITKGALSGVGHVSQEDFLFIWLETQLKHSQTYGKFLEVQLIGLTKDAKRVGDEIKMATAWEFCIL